jgi:hypothetical protein
MPVCERDLECCCEGSEPFLPEIGQKVEATAIISQGLQARLNYRARAANPYRAGDEKHRLWERGFSSADDEQEDQ